MPGAAPLDVRRCSSAHSEAAASDSPDSSSAAIDAFAFGFRYARPAGRSDDGQAVPRPGRRRGREQEHHGQWNGKSSHTSNLLGLQTPRRNQAQPSGSRRSLHRRMQPIAAMDLYPPTRLGGSELARRLGSPSDPAREEVPERVLVPASLFSGSWIRSRRLAGRIDDRSVKLDQAVGLDIGVKIRLDAFTGVAAQSAKHRPDGRASRSWPVPGHPGHREG